MPNRPHLANGLSSGTIDTKTLGLNSAGSVGSGPAPSASVFRQQDNFPLNSSTKVVAPSLANRATTRPPKGVSNHGSTLPSVVATPVVETAATDGGGSASPLVSWPVDSFLDHEVDSELQLAPVRRLDRWFRNRLFQHLASHYRQGQLVIVDQDGEHAFGEPSSQVPPVKLTVLQPVAYRHIALGGDLGFADALVHGEFYVDNLVGLLRGFLVNARASRTDLAPQSWWRRRWASFQHWLKRNTKTNSRRNIQAHYDLSNDFFALWLDPTWSYSSGVFPELQAVSGPSGAEWRSDASMEEASRLKLDRICEKLELGPDDHLLEIGCGWGGLAIHAAQNYGCRVTGVTLSPAQLEIALKRVQDAGLEDRIDLRLMDYRDVQGQFDKLVSVEMIEAVGHQYLDEYFSTCCRLLKPAGRMVLQGITIVDQRYPEYLQQVDFIREYIFPGGCLISTSAVMQSVARGTDFRMVHLEDIGQHYAETLRRWRSEFRNQVPQIRELGFDDRFFRMWDYYLAYCEAGFVEGHVGTVQVVLDRANLAVPTRLGTFSSVAAGQHPSSGANASHQPASHQPASHQPASHQYVGPENLSDVSGRMESTIKSPK